jgi:hypothetical protein
MEIIKGALNKGRSCDERLAENLQVVKSAAKSNRGV